MLELLVEPGSQVIYQPPKHADRDEEFERVCQLYPEMRIEMDESGNIIFMPPGSLDSGFYSNKSVYLKSFTLQCKPFWEEMLD